ncbi:hypothetical protein FACS1894205_2130 [Alphaproteobacteria bacterium]|nr:hypothetical protein FACS1894205_2130 [Alphaproteobacteria bacterium]
MSGVAFSDLVPLYRAIQFCDDATEGTLNIHDPDLLSLVQNAVSDENCTASGLHLKRADIVSVQVGDCVTLGNDWPVPDLGCLAKDMNAFLRFPGAWAKEPKNWFILSLSSAKTDEPAPDDILRYRDVLRLIELLIAAAAYQDKNELVFLAGGTFVIPVLYTVEDIQKIENGVISALCGVLTDDLHRAQKLEILSRTVSEITRDQDEKERFSLLLANLDEVKKQVSEGYRLFAADFSYSRIKDEMEAAKLDFAAKIHKVFSDVQNQILTAPVAAFVASTQMICAKSDADLIKNSILFLACIVFFVFLGMALQNQKRTLETVSEEARRQSEKIRRDFPKGSPMLGDAFSFIEEREKQQRRNLNIVCVIVITCFLVSAGLFLHNDLTFLCVKVLGPNGLTV